MTYNQIHHPNFWVCGCPEGQNVRISWSDFCHGCRCHREGRPQATVAQILVHAEGMADIELGKRITREIKEFAKNPVLRDMDAEIALLSREEIVARLRR